jgi:peptidoglycan/LPS O-acetylase OafA/YrhL
VTKLHRLSEIDALRGIAAVSVILFHFSLSHSVILPAKFFVYGCSGVDLFFMISGFVIYMSISAVSNLKDFWFSRVNRLFPSYWLSILIALATYYLFENYDFHKSWNYIIGNTIMMQPLFKTHSLVDAYWTLYVELTFYGFISALWIFKLNNRIETIIWTGLIIMIIVNGGYWLNQGSPGYVRFFIISRAIMPLISYFCFFAAGMVFYLIHTRGSSINRLLLLAVCFSITAVVHSISGRENGFFGTPERLGCVAVYYGLFALVVSNKAHFLRQPWLLYLGAISYALYLIHESIGLSLSGYLASYINVSLAVICGIFVSVIGAILITFKFERPVQKWLKTKYLRLSATKLAIKETAVTIPEAF